MVEAENERNNKLPGDYKSVAQRVHIMKQPVDVLLYITTYRCASLRPKIPHTRTSTAVATSTTRRVALSHLLRFLMRRLQIFRPFTHPAPQGGHQDR
eukprot:7376725-Prymnesium_polylepis.2